MPKLCQIIAIEDGTRKKEYADLSKTYKELQKPDLFNGFISTYQPLLENSIKQPDQRKVIQYNVNDILNMVNKNITELWNIVATKDIGNSKAKADIKIGERVIAKDVPVTYLLFLEKQLKDINDFINKIPILDPSKEWKFDDTKDLYVTIHPETRIKTKKIHKSLVKIEPGPHTPGDAEIITMDEPEGTWTQIDMSTAYPANKVRDMKERVSELQMAVKFAREEANSINVDKSTLANSIISYIFKG